MAYPIMPIPDLSEQHRLRFWNKVEVKSAEECWPWKGGLKGGVEKSGLKGYGAFSMKRRTFSAGRVAWYLHYGQDPGDSLVLHRCDNPPCCNPHHLFLGTHQDNATDKVLKGRSLKGERNPCRILFLTNPERLARGERSGACTHPEKIRYGTDNTAAKLTPEKVREIRSKFSSGKLKCQLAKEYGVSPPLIRYIVDRKIWKHVT